MCVVCVRGLCACVRAWFVRGATGIACVRAARAVRDRAGGHTQARMHAYAYLEHATRLLVDEAGDALDAPAAGQAADGGLGDACVVRGWCAGGVRRAHARTRRQAGRQTDARKKK